MAPIPYSEIKKELHKNPEFVREYEALAEEFRTAEMLIRALMAAGPAQQAPCRWSSPSTPMAAWEMCER